MTQRLKRWGIFTLDGLDQIVDSDREMKQEKHDLKNMGFKVWTLHAEEDVLSDIGLAMYYGASFRTAKDKYYTT